MGVSERDLNLCLFTEHSMLPLSLLVCPFWNCESLFGFVAGVGTEYKRKINSC